MLTCPLIDHFFVISRLKRLTIFNHLRFLLMIVRVQVRLSLKGLVQMNDLGGKTHNLSVDVTDDEKTWSIVAHLSFLLGFVIPLFGNILGPTIIFFIKKEASSISLYIVSKISNFENTNWSYLELAPPN